MTSSPVDTVRDTITEIRGILVDLEQKAIALVDRDSTHSNANVDVGLVHDTFVVGEPDGFPTSSMGPGGSTGLADTSSTEASVLSNYRLDPNVDDLDPEVHEAIAAGRWQPRPDPVHQATTRLLDYLHATRDAANRALSHAKLGEHLANGDLRHKNPPTDCLACTRTVECTTADPIRKGLCSTCDVAWLRYRRSELDAGREPDRAIFIFNRPKVDR